MLNVRCPAFYRRSTTAWAPSQTNCTNESWLLTHTNAQSGRVVLKTQRGEGGVIANTGGMDKGCEKLLRLTKTGEEVQLMNSNRDVNGGAED